jgi:hypothetical protein
MTMPPPELIPVRYTEEEAGYVSIRPVVRQSFRFTDLLGMVLSVTGKHPERIQQIVRSGSISYNSYRYWWDGFQIEQQELEVFLAHFPDPDPSRPFCPDACITVLLETGGLRPRPVLELDRAAASRRGLFRRRSFWDALLLAAASGSLAYDGYSYPRRADLYRLDLGGESRAGLDAAAKSLAPRDLRRDLRALDRISYIVFVCLRQAP